MIVNIFPWPDVKIPLFIRGELQLKQNIIWKCLKEMYSAQNTFSYILRTSHKGCYLSQPC